MKTIGDKYILISMNKNAHVIDRVTGQLMAELNLKSREMSSSCVAGEYLYIGTYVDTLFIFHLPTIEDPKAEEEGEEGLEQREEAKQKKRSEKSTG